MEFEEAIAVAILKHKNAITLKSNSCKPSTEDEDDLDLWCDLIKNDAESWCRWNTGEKCSCNDCGNMSLPKMVALFVYLFHLMDKDCLVQMILEKIPAREDVVGPTVEKHRKFILPKYTSVQELLSRCNGVPKHPRSLHQLYKYIMDTE